MTLIGKVLGVVVTGDREAMATLPHSGFLNYQIERKIDLRRFMHCKIGFSPKFILIFHLISKITKSLHLYLRILLVLENQSSGFHALKMANNSSRKPWAKRDTIVKVLRQHLITKDLDVEFS